jgi:hypothetical protein
VATKATRSTLPTICILCSMFEIYVPLEVVLVDGDEEEFLNAALREVWDDVRWRFVVDENWENKGVVFKIPTESCAIKLLLVGGMRDVPNGMIVEETIHDLSTKD